MVFSYSEAPKCTPEGRALQLLDVEHLCNKLEELSGIRPLPHRPHVENYIKAFYLPNEDLSKWIVHHTVNCNSLFGLGFDDNIPSSNTGILTEPNHCSAERINKYEGHKKSANNVQITLKFPRCQWNWRGQQHILLTKFIPVFTLHT